ncbi:hypothetical protein LWF15_13915 [Kineosporia rhizophila]|uniref:hypothetical protein n=1 Tax=Kineosporia rhizophila TaxID=84633 RepID=UPI000B2B946C|nr:hypothetical protein [Kineosporia rhizophila]MCE0536604.1 hypothetical protein [Kineosporia rhizophila]
MSFLATLFGRSWTRSGQQLQQLQESAGHDQELPPEWAPTDEAPAHLASGGLSPEQVNELFLAEQANQDSELEAYWGRGGLTEGEVEQAERARDEANREFLRSFLSPAEFATWETSQYEPPERSWSQARWDAWEAGQDARYDGPGRHETADSDELSI